MLEQIMNSLKSEVGGKLSDNSNLPAAGMEKIFGTLSDVVKKEVTGQMLSGNLSHLMNLFSNQPNTDQANVIQSNIHSDFVGNLMSKLGLSQETSTVIATTAVPALINAITKKNSTTPDDDPSPLHELFGTGGNNGILGTAKNLLGGFLNK
jgi:uncharacterized protein YidB (DUF937 family)